MNVPYLEGFVPTRSRSFEKLNLYPMRPRTLSAIGGWQSFLFCVGMYVIALFFSIFVCSAVFYAMNAKSASSTAYAEKSGAKQTFASVSH